MTPAIWDAEAATFDEQPDHGLKDPEVRAAWAGLLRPLMPSTCATVADLGCGTGSLAVLLAEAGHDVCGVDFSSAMIDVARTKAEAAGVHVDLRQGDAADPPCRPGSFDVVLVRHVLWAMPDPKAALERWISLLGPEGWLILVEGRWFTGAGITEDDCRALVREQGREADVRKLTEPALWGREIDDERYLLVSRPARRLTSIKVEVAS